MVVRLLNARSTRNKTLSIKDVVVEQDIAFLAISQHGDAGITPLLLTRSVLQDMISIMSQEV